VVAVCNVFVALFVCSGEWEIIRTCMHKSELLIPPSTASRRSACPLSFSMASRMALVWKQAASKAARAICPFCVY
jgi:hypothetical protein